MSFRWTQLGFVSVAALAVGTALILRWQTAPIVKDGWLDTDVYRFVRQAQATVEAAKKIATEIKNPLRAPRWCILPSTASGCRIAGQRPYGGKESPPCSAGTSRARCLGLWYPMQAFPCLDFAKTQRVSCTRE
jgi:hypothetical protein